MTGSNIRHAEMTSSGLVILQSERHDYYTDSARYIHDRKSAYKSGYRYCSKCELFIKMEGNRCECGNRLRTKARYKRDKETGRHYY